MVLRIVDRSEGEIWAALMPGVRCWCEMVSPSVKSQRVLVEPASARRVIMVKFLISGEG